MSGRTYFAKSVLSTSISDVFTEAYSGKKNYKRAFLKFLRWARCFLFGHRMVIDYWRSAQNQNWLKDKDYELHIGCRRCPKFRTEKP